APYVHENFATIVNYVPDNALVVYDEWDTIAIALGSYADRLDKTFEEGLAAGRLLPLPRPLHSSPREIAEALKPKQRVYMVSMPSFEDDGQGVTRVQFDSHAVERFNGQMQQFADRVKNWQREGYRVVVSTEQPQRLLGILKEWDCRSTYLAGPDDQA